METSPYKSNPRFAYTYLYLFKFVLYNIVAFKAN